MKPAEYLKTVYRWINRHHTTYSQTGEDVIANFFLEDTKNGFYIDIGANDPIYLNNTYFFYKRGWRGICVEPNAARAKVFGRVRPGDQVVSTGIAGKDGEMDYYEFYPDTLSTFSATEAEEVGKLGHKLMEKRKVKVMPLAELYRQYGDKRAVDLLSVDTEGFDFEILQSNNWQDCRPKLIVVETAEYRKDRAVRVHEKFNAYLAAQGYIKVADTYLNGVYMEKTYAEKKNIQGIL